MKYHPVIFAMLGLGVMVLACRPIVAIGWPELIILVVLIAFLLGPMLFKVYRLLDRIQKARELDDKEKK